MIIAFIHLLVQNVLLELNFNKSFLVSNVFLSLFVVFFGFLAFINKKLYYPAYPIIILFFQWTFFLILSGINNYQIVKVFLNFVLINMAFYLIQVIGSLIGDFDIVKLTFLGAEKAGVEYFWFLPRASGLINEPSHLSYILLPLCIIFLYDGRVFNINKKLKYVLYLMYLFTFSLISYFQLSIVFLWKYFRQSKIKFAFVFSLIFLAALIMSKTYIFSGRMAGIYEVMSGEKTVESSVLSIQSNFLVMIESLKTNPFFGGGITSHRATYNQFIGYIFPEFTEDGFLGLNQNDGSSLYILMLSEMGIIGLLLYFIFLFKTIINFKNKLSRKLIGFSFAVSLFFVGLRFGNIASFYIIFYLIVVLKELFVNEDSKHLIDSEKII